MSRPRAARLPAVRVAARWRVAAAGLLLWTACGTQPDPSDAAPDPGCSALRLVAPPADASLVLIVNDTMRRDRVGAYGGPAATPEFDRFARSHFWFATAASPAPWTKPAVASLFSGLYPSQHGVLGDPRRRGDRTALALDVLSPELPTLAEALRDAGFRTAAFVTNPWMGRAFGFAQGFEVYEDGFARFDADGALVTRAGLRWLDERARGERFFLYLHYIDSHLPYGRLSVEEVLADRALLEADGRPLPREAAVALRELRSTEGRSLLLSTGVRPSVALLERAYDAGLSAFDRALGEVLSGLRARGLWERSAVVVTSDHGEALYERGYGNHARALHEEEIAVPLAARLPGVAGDGEVDCPVGLVDLMPSLCHYLGVSCPAGAGASFLVDASREPAPARYLAAEGVPGVPAHRSVRNRRYKLVYEPAGPLGPDLARDAERGRAHPYRLYDLEADPDERRDLLAGDPAPEVRAIFERLREALDTSIPERAPVARERAPLDPELRERLRALGYLESPPRVD